MTFDEAFEKILGHEGGYVDNPRDPGGETKFGISKRAYPNVDIKNLSVEGAKMIYKKDYWDALACDSMPVSARLFVFDCAVNCGKVAAIKILQRAVKVKDDGVLGPMTLKALTNSVPMTFVTRFAGCWIDYYTNLSGWPTYGKGWVRRVANDLKGD